MSEHVKCRNSKWEKHRYVFVIIFINKLIVCFVASKQYHGNLILQLSKYLQMYTNTSRKTVFAIANVLLVKLNVDSSNQLKPICALCSDLNICLTLSFIKESYRENSNAILGLKNAIKIVQLFCTGVILCQINQARYPTISDLDEIFICYRESHSEQIDTVFSKIG